MYLKTVISLNLFKALKPEGIGALWEDEIGKKSSGGCSKSSIHKKKLQDWQPQTSAEKSALSTLRAPWSIGHDAPAKQNSNWRWGNALARLAQESVCDRCCYMQFT